MTFTIDDITFRSDMTVKLFNQLGDDKTVADIARVSTIGEKTLEQHFLDTATPAEREAAKKKDDGLVNFLVRDQHGSPFEHNIFTFYIEAPIVVWRETMRHRIASYNEESGRYRELQPVMYTVDADRNLKQEGKPGAYNYTPGTRRQFLVLQDIQKQSNFNAFRDYLRILGKEALDPKHLTEEFDYADGDTEFLDPVTREVARMHLPLQLYSSAYVSMNARGLMNFLKLRVKSEKSKPMREIEMVAEQMEAFFAEKMPVTHAAFVKHGRNVP